MILALGNKELITENQYETANIKRLVPLVHYGLDDSWYGGNCSRIAELNGSDLLLILDETGTRTIDIGVKPEHLENISVHVLREYAKKKSIPIVGNNLKKEEIINLIRGDNFGKENK